MVDVKSFLSMRAHLFSLSDTHTRPRGGATHALLLDHVNKGEEGGEGGRDQEEEEAPSLFIIIDGYLIAAAMKRVIFSLFFIGRLRNFR